MHVPAAFRVDDETRLLDAVERWPFGLLVDAVAPDEPGASHVPFVLERPARRLSTHLAAGNPQARRIDGARVLAVFRGPHAAVSPHELGEIERNVPTWNYIAVHVRARARRLHGRAAQHVLDRAVAAHEPGDWRRTTLEDDMRRRLEGAIAAFALDIETITGCWKLSQNKATAMQRRLRARLRARGGEARELARAMTLAGDHDAAAERD